MLSKQRPSKARNLAALTVIQGSNAVLPLIIFPYALYIFGSDVYQNIVYAEAVALFGVALVLFGYDLFGVKELVSTRARWPESDLFSIVLASRLLLFIVSTVLGTAFVAITSPETLIYFLCWLPMILSFAVQPNWYYQGIENNVFLAVCQIVSRVGIVIGIFVLADNIHGTGLVLMVSLGMLAGAVIAVWGACQIGQLRLHWPPFESIVQSLQETKEIFLSAFSVTLFRSSNVILLSLLGVNSDAVSLYSVVEKLIKAVQAICRPLNQFFYPGVLRACNDHTKPSAHLLKGLTPLIVPQLLVLGALWVTAALLSVTYVIQDNLVASDTKQLYEAAKLVAIMAGATGFGIVNFMLGSAALNAVGYQRTLLVCVLATGVLSLGLNILLIGNFGVTGAAIGYTVAETVLFSLLLYVYMHRNDATQKD